MASPFLAKLFLPVQFGPNPIVAIPLSGDAVPWWELGVVGAGEGQDGGGLGGWGPKRPKGGSQKCGGQKWNILRFSFFFLPLQILFFLLSRVVFSLNCGPGSRPWTAHSARLGLWDEAKLDWPKSVMTFERQVAELVANREVEP